MKNIIILFGEMGAGKNYYGHRIARKKSYDFFDGDLVATNEMISRVSKFRLLNRDIIERYIIILLSTILYKANTAANGLVVAQALYCDQDRIDIEEALRGKGFNVIWAYVKVPFFQHIKQLFGRKKGLLWIYYMLINKLFFQKPTHKYKEIK